MFVSGQVAATGRPFADGGWPNIGDHRRCAVRYRPDERQPGQPTLQADLNNLEQIIRLREEC